MKCKISGLEIKPFMSFGKMPIANGFLNEKEFKKEFFFNMQVGFSKKFSLFQLKDHPTPEQMFNNKYPFYTGSSELMKLHGQSSTGTSPKRNLRSLNDRSDGAKSRMNSSNSASWS